MLSLTCKMEARAEQWACMHNVCSMRITSGVRIEHWLQVHTQHSFHFIILVLCSHNFISKNMLFLAKSWICKASLITHIAWCLLHIADCRWQTNEFTLHIHIAYCTLQLEDDKQNSAHTQPPSRSSWQPTDSYQGRFMLSCVDIIWSSIQVYWPLSIFTLK